MEREEKEMVTIDIQSIDLSAVQATLKRVADFQSVVRSTLKEGHDYGVIPGTSKPTLLKPGAEKILMVFGLTSRYEILEAVRDYERGFFAFTVKCSLEKSGMTVTEGLGHANTREKRYTSGKGPDPWTLANTVLKIAKKRALVDAVLTVASLSEIFTQDAEDLFEEEAVATETHTRNVNGKATEKQVELILNLLRDYVPRIEGESSEEYRKRREEAFVKKFGKSINELEKAEASNIISQLEQLRKTKAPF